MSSVQRSVALHGDHPIHDNEVDRRRSADVENAPRFLGNGSRGRIDLDRGATAAAGGAVRCTA